MEGSACVHADVSGKESACACVCARAFAFLCTVAKLQALSVKYIPLLDRKKLSVTLKTEITKKLHFPK